MSDSHLRSERPAREHANSEIGWHSRVRYLFARQGLSGRERVLDLACGNGLGTVLLASVAGSVVGADVDPSAVETARRESVAPNVRYEVVTRPPFPFPDRAFDRIVSLETIEHLPRAEQEAFVADLDRMLAPGGVLVLSTPDAPAETANAALLHTPNVWHIHTPDADELESLLGRFPVRSRHVHVDLSAVVAGQASHEERLRQQAGRTIVDVGAEVRAPIARVFVCARSPEDLRSFSTSRPIASFRADPRLTTVDTLLEGSPFRRLTPVDSQASLIAASLGESIGDRGWWRARLLRRIGAELGRGKRVLEIGCGTGLLTNLLAESAASVRALSVSPRELDVAPRLCRASNVTFAPIDAPVPAEGFDVVVVSAGISAPFPIESCLAVGGISLSQVAGNDVAEGGLPVVGSLVLLDLVACAVLPEDDSARHAALTGGVESPWIGGDDAPIQGRIVVRSRDASAAARVAALPGAVGYRSDFQLDALRFQVLDASRTPDLSTLPHDEQLALLSARIVRLEKATETIAERINVRRRVDRLLRKLRGG